MENAQKVGGHLMNELKNIPELQNVRGRGLMIGFDVPEELKDLKKNLLWKHHIFTGEAKPNVVRLLPALNLTKAYADRFLEGAKYLEMEFFGRKAKFPLGPFIIASKFDAPVSYVFALKKSKHHYELSSTKPINERLSPEEFAQRYINELEKKVKTNPEQWFNYFDFYQ